MYAYQVYLYHTPIVLVFDLSVTDWEEDRALAAWVRPNTYTLDLQPGEQTYISA